MLMLLLLSCANKNYNNKYDELKRNNVFIDSDSLEFNYEGNQIYDIKNRDTIWIGEYSLNNISANSFYRMSITPKGSFQYFSIKSNNRGNYKDGGFETSFHKNKLQQIRFHDSLGFTDGLVFSFKKNGNIKHVLKYKHGKLDSIMFTNSPKALREDTVLLGRIGTYK